jgi:hypothetical protein
MAKDVIIIPNSGSLSYENNLGNVKGSITLNDSDELVISGSTIVFESTSTVEIGVGAGDVYIGDGVTSTDIVFEQNGEIRGQNGAGVNLTLGSPQTNVYVTSSNN